MSIKQNQVIMFCACGSDSILAKGFCASCYFARRRDLIHFDGLREPTLKRDGRRCTSCGADRQIVVHHRRPGVNLKRLFVTLCRACHARVHWLGREFYGMSEHLRELWREQHPRAPVQMEIDLVSGSTVAYSAGVFAQVILFELSG